MDTTAFHQLVAAMRVSQNAADLMEEAFAGLLGIGRTDARAIDIVQRLGPISLGELGEHCALTSGAVTALVDRLEVGGYLRRVRDTGDRRRIFVEVTALANEFGDRVYSALGSMGHEEMANMSPEAMRTVTAFLNTSAHLNRVMALALKDVEPKADASGDERLEAAARFADRMQANVDTLRDDLRAIWTEPVPDARSGKNIPG